jgi:hypothetical protein
LNDCPQFLGNLVSRCTGRYAWQRPSFDEIVALFEATDFQILLGVEPAAIREYGG